MLKKQTKLKLQEFWEKKLNISYAVEFEQYKKLCGMSYNRKLLSKKYTTDSDFIIYAIWRKNIIDNIKILCKYELEEYSRFLEQKVRENEVTFNLSQSVLLPFIIFAAGEFAKIIIEMFDKMKLNQNIDTIINIIVLIIFLGFILFQLKPIKEEPIRKYFYQDMKNIVNEKIEDIKNQTEN